MKPPKRRDDAYLYDIKTACSTIAERIRHQKFPDFAENGVFRDSILMQLLIIGEAAARITEKTRRQYPKIPWKAIVGLRNILIDAYWTYDLLEIWNTVTRDLPELLALLE